MNVFYHGAIEDVKIFIVFTPNVSKCFVFIVKKCIAWYDLIPITKFSFFIETHTELFVLVYSFHDDEQHCRKEFIPIDFLPSNEVGDVNV